MLQGKLVKPWRRSENTKPLIKQTLYEIETNNIPSMTIEDKLEELNFLNGVFISYLDNHKKH